MGEREEGNNVITSLWYQLLSAAEIAHEGIVVEFAPGFKSKIGTAFAKYNFSGEYHLIEPNTKALERVAEEYQKLLPNAKIYAHPHPISEIGITLNLQKVPTCLLANHALDDMVLGKSLRKEEAEEFFAMDSSPQRITRTKELWQSINPSELQSYIDETTTDVLHLLESLQPQTTMLSHYDGKTLRKNNINIANEVGYLVAHQLRKQLGETKEPYKSKIIQAGYGSGWVIHERRSKSLSDEVKKEPQAKARLHPTIFCEEHARKLAPEEYEVVYSNDSLLQGLRLVPTTNFNNLAAIVGDSFAYKLDRNGEKIVYADRQADPTDVALSGNEGSGRACYIGSNFNVKGIGRTQLAKNPENSLHGNGTLDLVTALREALISNSINQRTSTETSPALAVLALKDTTRYLWSETPLTNALLVRLDNGTLDRISHRAYTSIAREINFQELIQKYARWDAEMFGHQILHGAWSTGNSSLNGNWLDMESVSFIEGRGARCNITKKYLSNYFGYESIGIKQALDQLAALLNIQIKRESWESTFETARNQQLTIEMLRLLGINPTEILEAINLSPNITTLAQQFEQLAKKISPRNVNLNVFGNDFAGTHLLDFSSLFQKLPQIYQNKSPLDRMLSTLVREDELAFCQTEIYKPTNKAEDYLAQNAVIHKEQESFFLDETRRFLAKLLTQVHHLEQAEILPSLNLWEENTHHANKKYPNFAQLTRIIQTQVDKYHHRELSAEQLNKTLQEVILP